MGVFNVPIKPNQTEHSMPDGPPYIRSITEDTIPGPLGTHLNLVSSECYHITLDENRKWNVSCGYSLDTSQRNNNEFNIAFYKPTWEGGAFIGQFNNVHPDESGTWSNDKFDNEDIYVQGTFKHSPDPNQGFHGCGRIDAQVAETGESGTMQFAGDGDSVATLTLTLVP